jgi:hypothetical protein
MRLVSTSGYTHIHGQVDDSVVASPLGSNTTEVHKITISNQKINPTWYCWMEIPKATAPNTQSSLQVYQILDWMHSLHKDGTTISETKESHNENFW